ncbi:peroxisomal biogenesis factor 3 [Colletes gigas]|uniref:peroxisomal biogenesis factor 3 n=1 Tax=Colletes gigas TaxID=935657 RepID=UPI001C9B50E8|nr:peroxisomal biogenesis factor 3 [Colletes gigas]
MLSRIRAFINRHRQKFIVGGVVVSSVIFIRYMQRKLREWQEKEIKDMLERSKRRQYFDCTERTCDQMIISLASTLRVSIMKVVDTEAILNKLRSGCTDKIVCWNELRVTTITKSAVIIYSYAMLATLIRIQFNVMGGHVYKDTQKPNGTTTENIVQTKYMSLSGSFMHDGIKKLSSLIKDKVAEIVTPISLKDQVYLRDIEEIYWALTSSISTDTSRDPVKNLAKYMLDINWDKQQGTTIVKLINETLDLLESEEVQNITQSNIRSGFSLLVDHISAFFIPPCAVKNDKIVNDISIPGTSSQNHMTWKKTDNEETNHRENSFVNISQVSMPMAKIIPIINCQIPDKSASQNFQADLLQHFITNNELKTLGANIYEAFSF